MENRTCPLCNSSDVEWRQRRATNVLVTWFRYVTDFLFNATLKGGQLRPSGFSPGAYRDARTFDAPHRSDVGDSFHVSNTTHQALATPRFFWHCRHCGNKGEVYDDSLTDERN